MNNIELKSLRQQNKLTQFEMSEVMHIGCRMYQNYESGKFPIPAAFVELVKYKFGVCDVRMGAD